MSSRGQNSLSNRPGATQNAPPSARMNAIKRYSAPWHFISVGLSLFILCAVGLYHQVQYIAITQAPNLRVEQAPAKHIEVFPPGNPFASYQCIKWRQTGGCSPDGQREADNDRACDDPIAGGLSGYCEFYDPVKNETVHFLKMTCGTVRGDIHFSCNMAMDILMFNRHSTVYRHPWNMHGDPQTREYLKHEEFTPTTVKRNTYPPAKRVWYDQGKDDKKPSRGIVMVVYDKALVPLYASVRYLRHDLDSALPIEIWYRSDELNATNPVLQSLLALPDVTLREILDPLATSFYVKPYVIFFSHFQNVLFLDADNLPLRDPDFLFDTTEFQTNGALFWPDFWHPGHTIFNVHSDSLVWPMLNMSFVDMFEQESGQLVIDRARCERALHMLMFYAFHRIRPQEPKRIHIPAGFTVPKNAAKLPDKPNLIAALNLVWGDKDLFRLAWLKTGTPFYMMEHPPGALGFFGKPPAFDIFGNALDHDDESKPDRFCGQSMVQYDKKKRPLFLHRNTIKLGVSPTSRQRQWFEYQEFRDGHEKKDYVIEAWGERSSCFGVKFGSTDSFSMVGTKGTNIEHAETQLLKYANEAAAMLPSETTRGPTTAPPPGSVVPVSAPLGGLPVPARTTFDRGFR
ncbi:unnamed protein product [Aphanomyces euteiches]|uniref:Uncharacterized protein n=1 Tax=Aphanomyces euteiches TaxID=100861 RepID=A0A6G0WEB5_9STRA|nr:hypothetical protein Ae201684_016421 [Aphanomyces euteiches]KAH9082437.1 hypothetical protein Ae201684P_009762 [Aphanomyces euteiches]KAH9156754.1 hypothetical protein AeRB84_001349 [Aphanomyces euteiches]